MKNILYCFFLISALCSHVDVYPQNPFIRDQFTADPSARVFNGRVYVYPSHDILCEEGKGRPDWFCMEDYHVFSSENLVDWADHGMILSQYQVDWVDTAAYSMWAPDCIERNGKYYFYFPAHTNYADTAGRKIFSIGVAVSDQPEGPFIPQTEPIKNVRGIDPNVFIDSDGQAYLYWSQRHIFVARLKENMLELDSEPLIIDNLPEKGLKEGPWVFERNGMYYLTFPHVENETERLEYAVADNPMGPFRMVGVIMDESPTGCWTNHHSIIEYNQQWYMFYHHNDLSPHFDKNRSIRVDSLFFNADGTIRKVTPTLRGVGLTRASQKIEIDRYSLKSVTGASIGFIDTLDAFKGWKTILETLDAWIQYNALDFGTENYRSVSVRAFSEKGSTLQIRLNSIHGPIVAEVKIEADAGWNTIETEPINLIPGVQNMILMLIDSGPAEVDWIRFEKDNQSK